MKCFPILGIVCLFSIAPSVEAQPPVGPAFYGDPPDANHPWSVHDRNRPQPKRVVPGTFSTPRTPGKPPSDAIVLFDGKDLSKWVSTKRKGGKNPWLLVDGAMQCKPGTGGLRSKEEFGDCQLHIEWAAPKKVKGDSQGRGNSGVFLMGKVEVQVLDNFENPTYADGFAGSVYGINPPLANALHPPGQFQSYDMIFRRPIFKDGKEIDPGYVTVFCNGVLVQDHTVLEGPGGHKGRSKPRAFPEKGPIELQDHGNTTAFRNIWIRPLPPRVVEGGTDGFLPADVALTKRRETAAAIRKDAGKMKGVQKMFRLMESLVYAEDSDALHTATIQAVGYSERIGKMNPKKLEAEKKEILEVRMALRYMIKHQFLPQDFPPLTKVEKVAEDQGWNKKKK
ncbi:MAG: DUF1080 domain-containing protein [Verrucomicrobiota bacterium]